MKMQEPSSHQISEIKFIQMKGKKHRTANSCYSQVEFSTSMKVKYLIKILLFL